MWLLILLLIGAAALAYAWHRGWIDKARLQQGWQAWWSGESLRQEDDEPQWQPEEPDAPQVWQARRRQLAETDEPTAPAQTATPPAAEAAPEFATEPLSHEPPRSEPRRQSERRQQPAPVEPPQRSEALPTLELPLAVPRYIRKKPEPQREAAKPVIGLAEVQRNLQYDVRRREKLAAHERRARRELLVKAPVLPVIDPQEVRDAVRQLHPERDEAPEPPKPFVVLHETTTTPSDYREPLLGHFEPSRSEHLAELNEQARQQLRESLLGKRREAELKQRQAQQALAAGEADEVLPEPQSTPEPEPQPVAEPAAEPPMLLIPDALQPHEEEAARPPLLLLAEEERAADELQAELETALPSDEPFRQHEDSTDNKAAQPLWPPFGTVVTASSYQLKSAEVLAANVVAPAPLAAETLPPVDAISPESELPEATVVVAAAPAPAATWAAAVEREISSEPVSTILPADIAVPHSAATGWRWPDETAHVPARALDEQSAGGPGWHFVDAAEATAATAVSQPLHSSAAVASLASADSDLPPWQNPAAYAPAAADEISAEELAANPDSREALAAKLARLRELEAQYATVEAALATPPAAKPHVPPVVYGDVALPGLELLRPPEAEKVVQNEEYLIDRGILIEEKCAEFKVKVSVVDAYAGPVITRYEVEPAVGVRGSQVVNLGKDLSRALGVASIRVVETIPGKTCMGLELPNPKRQMIRLSEIFGAEVFTRSASKLTLALGQDISGAPVVTDLAKAPHLLVAGTTGSGKSVGVNAMILSMLYKATPDEVRFIMIDPKMLELSIYNDIPHLLAPVVTDMKLAANALNWCVGEMEKRYRLMSHLGVRNLAGYNEKVLAAEARGQRLSNPFSLTPETPEPLYTLPFIVVVVDEFADLMMVAGKKIEELIARLAQKARAAGIHLILATQRPSVDVITGLIKANIPTRVAFQVSSKIDSRTILDQMGAESLLGQGDMLFLPPGTGYPQRVHGAFVTDEEVHSVVEYLKQWGEPDYIEGLLTGESEADDEQTEAKGRLAAATETDPLYDEAVEIVLRTRKASISSVQRQLRIGYNRAARLIEDMEAAGIVSAMENNGNRTVLVPQREF